MELQTMSTADLQKTAKEMGLETWGTKRQLIERIQKASTEELSDNPVYSEKPEEVKEVSAEDKTDAHETLEFLRRRFTMLNVKYDDRDNVFQFEGGPQGRLTTTAAQPRESIIKVAASYINVAQNAVHHNVELGKFGG